MHVKTKSQTSNHDRGIASCVRKCKRSNAALTKLVRLSARATQLQLTRYIILSLGKMAWQISLFLVSIEIPWMILLISSPSSRIHSMTSLCRGNSVVNATCRLTFNVGRMAVWIETESDDIRIRCVGYHQVEWNSKLLLVDFFVRRVGGHSLAQWSRAD